MLYSINVKRSKLCLCVFVHLGTLRNVKLPLLPFSARPPYEEKARIVEIFIVFATFVTLITLKQFCLGLHQQECTHVSVNTCVYVEVSLPSTSKAACLSGSLCVLSCLCTHTCVLVLCNRRFIPALSSDTGHGVRAKLLQPQTTPTALWELPTMPE